MSNSAPSQPDSPSSLPLVTVALSCYNHAAYITAAVRSIVNQTYPNIEFLVFDDGSRDQSPQILRSLSKKHGFIYQEQNNRGLSATLNDALARAKGKYFFQMGSDDISFIDKIEKQVAFMEANSQFSVCGGNALYIDKDGVFLINTSGSTLPENWYLRTFSRDANPALRHQRP